MDNSSIFKIGSKVIFTGDEGEYVYTYKGGQKLKGGLMFEKGYIGRILYVLEGADEIFALVNFNFLNQQSYQDGCWYVSVKDLETYHGRMQV